MCSCTGMGATGLTGLVPQTQPLEADPTAATATGVDPTLVAGTDGGGDVATPTTAATTDAAAGATALGTDPSGQLTTILQQLVDALQQLVAALSAGGSAGTVPTTDPTAPPTDAPTGITVA